MVNAALPIKQGEDNWFMQLVDGKERQFNDAEQEITKGERISTITLSRIEVPALERPIDDGFTF